MENKFYQMSKHLQQKQETQMNHAFEQIHQTIIKFNTQQNQIIGNTSTNQRLSTLISEFRPKLSQVPTNDERDTTLSEPALPFYKPLISMSINDEAQMEHTNS